MDAKAYDSERRLKRPKSRKMCIRDRPIIEPPLSFEKYLRRVKLERTTMFLRSVSYTHLDAGIELFNSARSHPSPMGAR